jgi:hypothetical protein
MHEDLRGNDRKEPLQADETEGKFGFKMLGQIVQVYVKIDCLKK